MKIELTTSAKSVELTNMVIARAVESLEEQPHIMKAYGLSLNDLEKVKSFRKSLINAFLKK